MPENHDSNSSSHKLNGEDDTMNYIVIISVCTI